MKLAKHKRFYTDEELRYLPPHFALEDLTRDEVEVALGLSHDTVSRLRSGRDPLTDEHLTKLRAYVDALPTEGRG